MGLIRNRDAREDDPGPAAEGPPARELDDDEFAALPGDPPPPAPGTTTEPGAAVDPVPAAEAAPAPPPAPESVVDGPPPPPVADEPDRTVAPEVVVDLEPATPDEPGAAPATPGGPGGLVTAAADFQDRWELIQVDFVDDPRAAVSRADGLVGDVVDEIMRALATEREQLSGAWRDDDAASTEDLRLALQRYRAVFQRLLRT